MKQAQELDTTQKKRIDDLRKAKENLEALPPDKQAIAVNGIFTLYAAYCGNTGHQQGA